MFSSQQDNTAFACTYIPYYFYVSLLSFSCAPFLGSGQKQRLVLEGFTWRERGLLLLGHSQFEFSAREFDLECFFFEPTLFYNWWVSHCERFDSIFWLFWEEEEEEILGFVWFQVSGFFDSKFGYRCWWLQFYRVYLGKNRTGSVAYCEKVEAFGWLKALLGLYLWNV